MFTSFTSHFGRGSHPVAAAPNAARPRRSAVMIEPLEARQFLSAAPAAAADPPVDGLLKTQTERFANKVAKNGTTTVLPLTITDVVREGDQLIAQGTLGDTAFTAPLTLGATPNPADTECPILNLELGPIHLDVLGLVVDTSRICLDIIADPEGGLLGDLLCGVANLLDDGLPLGNILDSLGGQLNQLLDGLSGLLSGVFSQVTAPSSVAGVSDSPDGHCDILNLSLGPVDLNVLGLEVHLDDCEDGPVTVDITAEPGPGNLLGNLLCGVAGLLDNPSNPNAVANAVTRVANEIFALV